MRFLKAVLNIFIFLTIPLWVWAWQYYLGFENLMVMGKRSMVYKILTGKRYFWEI